MSIRQDVQKRRVWAERLERFRASGLTVSRFCASQRVSENTFYYWASRLRTDSTTAGSPRTPSRPRGKAAELGHERARQAHAAAGTAQPALVRFQFNEAVEISVPADCLEAIRCLAQCAQQARVESARAFQEVVVARR
ncbi:MAG TPA: hypothetical protein VHY20_07420 [Pirellulales bacterium]|jgi:hypothetical protein|nr:hypothetical protein [Pirellulales bacterium]